VPLRLSQSSSAARCRCARSALTSGAWTIQDANPQGRRSRRKGNRPPSVAGRSLRSGSRAHDSTQRKPPPGAVSSRASVDRRIMKRTRLEGVPRELLPLRRDPGQARPVANQFDCNIGAESPCVRTWSRYSGKPGGASPPPGIVRER
jgi:hypothetical protein